MSFPQWTDQHRAFRDTVRRFTQEEIRPNAERWQAEGYFPDELFRKAGKLGLLGIRFDPEWGGSGLDYWYTVILVEELVPNSVVTISDEAFNDIRNYRVSCDKIARMVPGFKPQWTVRRGIEQLYEQYVKNGLTLEQLEGDQFMRVKHIGRLLASEQLDSNLRWSNS